MGWVAIRSRGRRPIRNVVLRSTACSPTSWRSNRHTKAWGASQCRCRQSGAELPSASCRRGGLECFAGKRCCQRDGGTRPKNKKITKTHYLEEVWVKGASKGLAADTMSGTQQYMHTRPEFPGAWSLLATWSKAELPARAPRRAAVPRWRVH